jgi:hypothetical protein
MVDQFTTGLAPCPFPELYEVAGSEEA